MELETFLRNHFDSVEQLEVLCLLHDQPKRAWSALDLSREIRSSETSVTKRLQGLVASRVLLAPAEENKFIYQPASPETGRLIGELLAFYRLRPHRVMDLLYSKPESAMRSFADAFRLHKKEKP